PLFTFAAYLGAVMHPTPNGVPGAALALSAIFLPAFLLVIGVLPFWDMVRSRPGFRSALAGVNAAVVGLLLAALYQPIWTTSVRRTSDVVLALLAFGLLTLWRAPPWIVVLFSCAAAVIGQAVGWTL
ncbi:MAG TPA: chromate transporter, partial [Chloroflexota bacterium]